MVMIGVKSAMLRLPRHLSRGGGGRKGRKGEDIKQEGKEKC